MRSRAEIRRMVKTSPSIIAEEYLELQRRNANAIEMLDSYAAERDSLAEENKDLVKALVLLLENVNDKTTMIHIAGEALEKHLGKE